MVFTEPLEHGRIQTPRSFFPAVGSSLNPCSAFVRLPAIPVLGVSPIVCGIWESAMDLQGVYVIDLQLPLQHLHFWDISSLISPLPPASRTGFLLVMFVGIVPVQAQPPSLDS